MVDDGSLPLLSNGELKKRENAAESSIQPVDVSQHTLSGHNSQSEEVFSVQQSVIHHLDCTLAKRGAVDVGPFEFYQATARSVRDHLIERWADTECYYTEKDVRRVYYLSLEFLVGRTLQNALHSLGLKDSYGEALQGLGCKLEDMAESEKDPALGNGGLGRLASCFLDSMATLNYPAWGYGIRYKYGMFEQKIINNQQAEFPDYWLTHCNPWEVERLDVQFPVQFYGRVRSYVEGPKTRFSWEGGESVLAVAYDTPIPGYDTWNTNNMRLWSSRPVEEFDLAEFNAGRHVAAVEARAKAEAISSVLYPKDDTDAGKELRLKQQFFFVSATLQDILSRYKKTGRPLRQLHLKVAIQLNDTHPTISIPELMRLLLDEENLEWVEAWDITRNTFAYTNHTILPEALERWPVPLVEKLLPRHMEIIYEINHRHLKEVELRWPNDMTRLSNMSVIEECHPKMVRMAVLATIGAHTVNGVAKIHTGLVKSRLFPDFVDLWPNKFMNKTNGVTPRRWLLAANPSLSQVITKWLGTSQWVVNADLLEGLREHAGEPELLFEWQQAKAVNKSRLAAYVYRVCGIELNTEALFNVQAKRFHEYKRQLLHILGVIHRYSTIKTCSPEERSRMVPHVSLFAGKAAPGYFLAKCIIHLINCVADRVNNDEEVGDLLKVVYIPNYNVSLAEVIIPASDISQHISTAGMEASGTSNMKFVLNGGLILGTMDGANIEIADAIGKENMFICGATAEQTDSLRHALRYRDAVFDISLHRVMGMVQDGVFGPYENFRPLIESLLNGNDFYLLTHDWPSYLDAQACADATFVNKADWTRRSILSTSMMGRFSSDRTIAEYAREIWHVQAVQAVSLAPPSDSQTPEPSPRPSAPLQ